MEAFREFLQEFPHYTPSAFESVLPFLSEKTIQPSEFLLREGNTSRHIAFIESGLVRQFYYHDDKEVTFCFCRENSVTTSSQSFILQKKSDLSIQALEETKLILLSHDSLQKLFEIDPFWQQLARFATQNELIRSESHSRLLKDKSATDRYLEILNNDKALLQRVPLNYLASYLQVTPETLSRIRKKISRSH